MAKLDNLKHKRTTPLSYTHSMMKKENVQRLRKKPQTKQIPQTSSSLFKKIKESLPLNETTSTPLINKKRRTASHKKGCHAIPLPKETLLAIANQVTSSVEESLGKKLEKNQQRELHFQQKEIKKNAKKIAKEQRLQEIKNELLKKKKN